MPSVVRPDEPKQTPSRHSILAAHGCAAGSLLAAAYAAVPLATNLLLPGSSGTSGVAAIPAFVVSVALGAVGYLLMRATGPLFLPRLMLGLTGGGWVFFLLTLATRS